MTFCKAWNAGYKVALEAWEVAVRAKHGETPIWCRECGWVGPMGLIGECAECGSRYVRLAERREVVRSA